MSDEMRRTGFGWTPEDRSAVVDHAADFGMDAAEAGVEPEAIASALREAADEILMQDREGSIDTGEDNE